MTAFDDAVRHDLAAAPQPASLDRLRRLARRRRSRKTMSTAVALLVGAIAVGLLVVPTHHSGTVAVQPTTPPTITPAPPSTGTVAPLADSVLAIGDSVMEGSNTNGALGRAISGVTIDALRDRRFYQAASVVDAHKRFGPLPNTIVIHLGDNDAEFGRTPTAKTLDDLMNAIGPHPTVYVLTVQIPRTSESAVNDALRRLATRRANVRLLDWKTYSQPHPEWFLSDGFHLVESGQTAYAAFILDGIEHSTSSRSTRRTTTPTSVTCKPSQLRLSLEVCRFGHEPTRGLLRAD